MLDTFIITIPEIRFKITDFSKFDTTEAAMSSNPTGFKKKPNKMTGKSKGEYLPKLTLIKRGLQCSLKIEASARGHGFEP